MIIVPVAIDSKYLSRSGMFCNKMVLDLIAQVESEQARRDVSNREKTGNDIAMCKHCYWQATRITG